MIERKLLMVYLMEQLMLSYQIILLKIRMQKDLPFNQAEFGGVGLETLSLTLSLVKNYDLDLISAISLITKNPSDILGLNVGSLKINNEADITVFDLD